MVTNKQLSHNSFAKIKVDFILIKKIIVLCTSIIICYVFPDVSGLKYVGVYLLVITALLVYDLRKNILTLIIAGLLFWFNYSIIVANYFSSIKSFFLSESHSNTSINGLRVLVFFVTFLYVLISDKTYEYKSIDFNFNQKVNPLIAVGYIIVLILILLFGFKRPEEFGQRGSPSTLYEYSIIIFIVGYYYFRNIRVYNVLSTSLLFLYSLQNLVFGGRATAIQELLIFFILFIHQEVQPNYKKIIPLAVFSLLVFTTVGMYRGEFNFSFEQFNNAVIGIKGNMLTNDTAFSAYYTSLTFIKTEYILPTNERLRIFFNWVLSQIIGGNYVSYSNVPYITREYFVHYYGGVLPFYGHFFASYFGVAFFSFIVSYYLKKCNNFNNLHGAFKCYIICFVVTVPRWYLYSPTPLFRNLLLTIVVYFITYYANKMLTKSI